MAAVSIDRDGVAFPPGSIWIHNAEGWTWAKDYCETPPAITALRIRPVRIATTNLTKHRCECEVCGKVFYAQRRDAKYCSLRHRVKASRQRASRESPMVSM
jgi:hypothetical protein